MEVLIPTITITGVTIVICLFNILEELKKQSVYLSEINVILDYWDEKLETLDFDIMSEEVFKAMCEKKESH